MNTAGEAIEYAKNILSGKIIAGELIKLACKRFLEDMDKVEYEYRVEKIEKCLRFLNLFKHYTGKCSGKPFILLPF